MRTYVSVQSKRWSSCSETLKEQGVSSGEWDITGGAALSGESGSDAVIRETFEEIGISLSEDELNYIGRIIKPGRIIDVFFAQKDFDIIDCHVQDEEVDEIKFVSCHELLGDTLIKRGRKEDYISMIKDAIEKRGSKDIKK